MSSKVSGRSHQACFAASAHDRMNELDQERTHPRPLDRTTRRMLTLTLVQAEKSRCRANSQPLKSAVSVKSSFYTSCCLTNFQCLRVYFQIKRRGILEVYALLHYFISANLTRLLTRGPPFRAAPVATQGVVIRRPQVGDGPGSFFSMFLKMEAEEDTEMVERWQKDADTILVFVCPYVIFL